MKVSQDFQEYQLFNLKFLHFCRKLIISSERSEKKDKYIQIRLFCSNSLKFITLEDFYRALLANILK